jgi:crotonobetaine/carnitine-CoA ligase
MTPSSNGYADLIEAIRAACQAEPDKPALIFEDGVVVTRARLWSGAESFAGYLQQHIEPGERVAIMMPNRAEFMIAWLAVVAARGVLVPLNPTLRSYDAGHILRDSAARVAIANPEHETLFRDLQAGCPDLEHLVIARDTEPGGLAPFRGRWSAQRPPDAAGDITNVYYTSGTTGPPKGCMVDHEYWLRFAGLITDLYDFTSSDRLLCCLQFFYNDPPWQLLLSLIAGTSLVVMRRFSVSRYWDVVRENQVTVLFGIAATASLLLKAPPGERDREHNVRLAIHVGIPAQIHAELVKRWGVPWVEAYGLTETGAIVTMPAGYADAMTGSGSIGLPCPGAEVRVVRPAGEDVSDDETGEIVVRAPGLMRGYLNRPEATAETFRGGWLHTGDLGRRDSRGFLYFQGRIKDIIRRLGENIAATEVENVLRSHPKVLEVAAVPAPDDLRGEEVKVHVLLTDSENAAACPPEDLIAFCAEHLARYKVPRFIEYRTADFDRTPSMRVKKKQLDRSADDRARVWDREEQLGW